MSNPALPRTQQLYRYAATAILREHRVQEGYVRSIARALKVLHEQVDREDPEWDSALRPLRRYFFDLRHLPLPTGHSSLGGAGIGERLAELVKPLGRAHPLRQTAEILAGALELPPDTGAEGTSSPSLHSVLLNVLRESGDRCERVAVLLREYRYLEPVKEDLARRGFRGVVVDTERGVVRSEIPDHLVVVGPRGSYPDHLTLSPRAQEVDFIRHAWLRDERPPGRLLPDCPGRMGGTLDIEAVWHGRDVRAKDEGGLAEVDTRDLEPVTHWKSLLPGVSSGEHSGAADSVPAKAFLLADRHIVFLRDTPDASVLTLDIEEVDSVEIARVRVRELGPGMYVLLRTRGASDYVASVADRILQFDSTSLRADQQRWKEAVRVAIEHRGESRVLVELNAAGAVHANRQNLRNWVDEDTIHPMERQDFDALIKVAGLAAESDELWERMKAIESAHRRAGQAIRKELLRQVGRTDPDKMISAGRADFTLPHGEGGAISAFRILKAMDETVEVPYQDIGCPVRVDA